jgi:hypothetical protein
VLHFGRLRSYRKHYNRLEQNLAYYEHSQIADVKSFAKLGLGPNVKKTIYQFTNVRNKLVYFVPGVRLSSLIMLVDKARSLSQCGSPSERFFPLVRSCFTRKH